MTMATPNDINPTFEWKPEYLVQLQHIADTDEFQPDDTAHPQLASTSSASGASASSHSSTLPAASQPSGAYDWQILKEAIKYRIRTCLEQEFGRERGLELHPAAALMPWMQPGADMEVTWHRANMGLLCSEAGGGEGEAMEVSGDDGEGATASASVEEGNTDVTESAEAGADHAQTNGTSEATATTTTAPSAATATAAAASSATSADELSQYAYRARLNDSNLIHPPFVHRADVQSFYPSKRPPPPPPSTSTTLPLLTPNQLTTHLHTLYTMLEDFDVQPPFTIQRLCELLVAPTAHYNSASKWIAALKRCLSVTATRDAFPISPVQRAAAAVVGGVGANGCGGGGGGGGGGGVGGGDGSDGWVGR